MLLLSIRLHSCTCSPYPADSTPCPADTLLPKRVTDLISLHFTELIHSVFASLQRNGNCIDVSCDRWHGVDGVDDGISSVDGITCCIIHCGGIWVVDGIRSVNWYRM